MKEEKTESRKKLIYYLVLAVSVLLLVAATVLTVLPLHAEAFRVAVSSVVGRTRSLFMSE